MSGRHPLLLDLAGRRVVVVGGGPVAARRVLRLVEDGADVVVVAPAVCEDLAELLRPDHLAPARLPDHGPGRRVARAHGHGRPRGGRRRRGRRRGGPPVVRPRRRRRARRAPGRPAVARAGDVTVAVGAGGDPRRATALRDAIAPAARHRRAAAAPAPAGRGQRRARRRRSGRPRPDHHARPARARRGRRGRRRPAGAPRPAGRAGPVDVEVIEAGKSPHAHTLTQTEINARPRRARRWPATGSCGSRAVTRSCSVAAVKRSSPASPPGSPSRWSPG